MECKCETCVRKDCADRTKQDDLRMVIACTDYLNTERQMTNADRIRAMTDEELAKFLYACEFCHICEEGCDNCSYNGDCERRLADWLQQPAEGDA